MNQILEEWRAVAAYEGLYEVSNIGRVKSIPRRVPKLGGKLYTVTGRILKQVVKASSGHMRVYLSKEGRLTTFYVHRLVAVAFLGSIPRGFIVCHKVNDPTDNRVSNLYYGTPLDNQKDRIKDRTDLRGSACSWSKLSETDVYAIKSAVSNGIKQIDIARTYGVSAALVCNIVNKKVWKHT
jgi:hypothetical protein